MKNLLNGGPKYFAGFIGTLIFRLFSPLFGLWNISPLMATELAGAKTYGPWRSGMNRRMIGHGAVGVFGAYFLINKTAGAGNFVVASIIGTLFFDFVTGILMGPLMFGQPWGEALFGQIPFTLRHLLGNIFFAVALALWFYRKIMINPSWQFSQLFKFA